MLTHTSLGPTAFIPSTTGSLYANPSGEKTFVRALLLFNGNTTTEVVQIYNVPNSGGSLGTVGADNAILYLSLLAKETLNYEIPGPGIILQGHNDSIQGQTTTASKVTVTLIGDIDDGT